MSFDNRKALPNGYLLTITDEHSGNTYTAEIKKEIGRGGSCIVYRGMQKDFWVGNKRVEKDLIIKEFYPKEFEMQINRSDDFLLDVLDSVQGKFLARMNLFCEGQAKHMIYANANSDKALPPVEFSGRALGTFYAVSSPGKGMVLADYDRNAFSLIDALEIGASVCEAVSFIHDGGSERGLRAKYNLFLDCKPDNIYVFENKAYLFDFDTVQPYGKIGFCSFSKGYSAPEQELVGKAGYADTRKIGFHTDVFSIGAVLFELLVGEKPADAGLENIQRGYDWHRISLRDETGALEDNTFTAELDRIMKAMLQPDPDIRKEDFGKSDAAVKVRNELLHLKNIAETAPYKRGFEDTGRNIEAARESIEKTVRKHSMKEFLFGSRKRVVITLLIFALSGLVFGVFSGLGSRAVHETAPLAASLVEQDPDDHLLIKLANASHQYEVGIENWRRLDYIRAERDILAARDEMSEEIAQSEIEAAKVNNSLGCLYLDMGRYADAYDCLTSAYITFRDQLGEDSVESRAVRASLAQYYYSTGKQDEAFAETQYILDHSDESTEKAIIARTLHLRAMIYDAQGKYDEALSLYGQVLAMYSDISEDGMLSGQLADYANDPELTESQKDYYTNAVKWIIFTYSNISKVNIHKEDYATAIEAADTGLELSLSNPYIGKRNLTTSRLYLDMAIAQGSRWDVSEALDNVDLAMRIQRNLFDFEDIFPGLVEVYDVYGDLLVKNGDYEQAERYYIDAIDLAVSSFGLNHPDTANAFHAFGNYSLYADNIPKALDYLEKAIEIRKNILAEKHPVTARIYYDLATAQTAAGNEQDARENLIRARDICEEWKVSGSLPDLIDGALKWQ